MNEDAFTFLKIFYETCIPENLHNQDFHHISGTGAREQVPTSIKNKLTASSNISVEIG